MDLNRLMTMLLRRLLNRGVSAGIKHVASRGADPAEMTPADRAQARQAQDMAKRARQMSKMARKLGR